jgi:hypothetical protein
METIAKDTLTPLLDKVREALAGLSGRERVDFFYEIESGYCRHCGAVEPEGCYCQCMNDE